MRIVNLHHFGQQIHYKVEIQNDGNLILYSNNGSILWETNATMFPTYAPSMQPTESPTKSLTNSPTPSPTYSEEVVDCLNQKDSFDIQSFPYIVFY